MCIFFAHIHPWAQLPMQHQVFKIRFVCNCFVKNAVSCGSYNVPNQALSCKYVQFQEPVRKARSWKDPKTKLFFAFLQPELGNLFTRNPYNFLTKISTCTSHFSEISFVKRPKLNINFSKVQFVFKNPYLNGYIWFYGTIGWGLSAGKAGITEKAWLLRANLV